MPGLGRLRRVPQPGPRRAPTAARCSALRSGRYPDGRRGRGHRRRRGRPSASPWATTLDLDGIDRPVVGIVENPADLDDEFALVAPGRSAAPTSQTVLVRTTDDRISATAARAVPHGGRDRGDDEAHRRRRRRARPRRGRRDPRLPRGRGRVRGGRPAAPAPARHARRHRRDRTPPPARRRGQRPRRRRGRRARSVPRSPAWPGSSRHPRSSGRPGTGSTASTCPGGSSPPAWASRSSPRPRPRGGRAGRSPRVPVTSPCPSRPPGPRPVHRSALAAVALVVARLRRPRPRPRPDEGGGERRARAARASPPSSSGSSSSAPSRCGPSAPIGRRLPIAGAAGPARPGPQPGPVGRRPRRHHPVARPGGHHRRSWPGAAEHAPTEGNLSDRQLLVRLGDREPDAARAVAAGSRREARRRRAVRRDRRRLDAPRSRWPSPRSAPETRDGVVYHPVVVLGRPAGDVIRDIGELYVATPALARPPRSRPRHGRPTAPTC